MPETTSPAAPLAIFKAGRHTAVDGREIEFTDAQLSAAAAGYDPVAAEAPLVVGHPAIDAPAYGWVDGLKFKDGVLYAEPKQIDPAFADMVNAGRFKKISASFYLPDSHGNPKPGTLYLKHVGFLGAAAPAVKGLRAAAFTENDGAVTIEFAAPGAKRGAMAATAELFRKVKAHLSKTMPADQVNAIIPDAHIDCIDPSSPATSFAAPPAGASTTEPPMSKENDAADFAAREDALKKKSDDVAAATDALKTREAAIAKAESDAARKITADFVEGLAKEGKVLPRHKTVLVEVLSAFPANGEISFAEGTETVKKSPVDVLKGFLTSLPKQIDFAEKSADEGDVAAASFAAADGAMVDQKRLEVHNKALAHQRTNPNCSYIDAVHAVGGR